MSVYLKDGLVLLDSGRVATSSDCCCCPSTRVSTFIVNFHIYGTIYFPTCNPGCHDVTLDPQSIDFTESIFDDGSATCSPVNRCFGGAIGIFDGVPFTCGDFSLVLQAYLYCESFSSCSHGDKFEVQIIMAYSACNEYTCPADCGGSCPETAPYTSSVIVGTWDTDCLNNSTYLTIPSINGTFDRSTSMTAQGDNSGPCIDVLFPNRDLGAVSIDVEITVAP